MVSEHSWWQAPGTPRIRGRPVRTAGRQFQSANRQRGGGSGQQDGSHRSYCEMRAGRRLTHASPT